MAGQFGHLTSALAIQGALTEQTELPVPVAQSGDPTFEQERIIKTQLNALKVSTDNLAMTVNNISRALNAATQLAKISNDISSCQITPVNIGFRVFPDVESQEIMAGSSFSFSIISITGIPQATLAGSKIDDVNLDTKLSGGTVMSTITVGENAPNASTNLLIRDGTGKSEKNILIMIKAKSKPNQNLSHQNLKKITHYNRRNHGVNIY